MAPLQKRALLELALWSAALAVLLPIIVFVNDLAVVLLVLPVIALAYWIPQYLTRPRPGQPVTMDERDQYIIAKVMGYRRAGIILAVFAWFSVFFLRTDVHGEVTVTRLSLQILWICVFTADLFSSLIGTLIEYWRAK